MLRNIAFRIHKRKKKKSDIVQKKLSNNFSISLEEILSEETLIEELEDKAQIIINYLTKEKIKKVIDYIIIEPPDGSSHDRGYKFPWVCSQLFMIENSPLLKYLYKTNKELNEENKENNSKMDLENKNQNMDNKIELLDYLLTFLETDKEPNYVLCGYFASIIKALFKSQPIIMLKYFYKENKEFIKHLIKFSYRESIAEILSKIFLYDTSVEKFNIEEMDLFRMETLEELFNEINIDMNNEKLDSFATLIKNLSTDENLFSDLLNNRIIIQNLITKPLKDINLLITDKSKEEEIINKRRNFIIIIDIIINWIKAISTLEIDIPSTTDESEDDNKDENVNNNFSHTLLSFELINILLDLIKINFDKNEENNKNEKTIIQSFDEKKLIPLGFFRIKIVELLGCLFSYFKNIPNLYDKILIESKFFENAIDYLFEYEFNNIYQESLLYLFKKYLDYSEYHPLLSEFLFTKINLPELIISKIKSSCPNQDSNSNTKKDSFFFTSGNTLNRGYNSFLISLSYKINTIIGGDPLRINDTLSREGSISFINRAQPFVPKEDIMKFYGMEENELYEDVSNEGEGNKKSSKLNCSVKCMEKYLNDNWNEFFCEYISDKIKLYETKLYKDDPNRDSIFRNPFILEEDDEKVENRQNNFGLGEDQAYLSGKSNKPDFNKILYADDDIDFNSNNRFKMSMRLPRSNNNNNMNLERKRSSLGDKPMKVLVDEVDNFDDSKDKDDNDDMDENEEKEEKEEKEEENPLDAFNKNKKDDENNENDEDPFANFAKKEDGRKISLVSFRKKKKEEDIENKEDKEDEDILMENNNDEENEENPLDKFKKSSEEKMDIENNNDNDNDKNTNRDLYDDNEDEDAFKNLKKEENKIENNDNNNENLFEDNLYEDNEEQEEENPLDKDKKENEDKTNDNNIDNDTNQNKKEEDKEKEEEDPFSKFKKEKNENKDSLDKINKEKDKSKEKNVDDEENEDEEEEEKEDEENPLDKFNRENKNKIEDEKKDEKKEDNLDDILYETKEVDDDNKEEEEEEEDDEDNNEEEN